MLVLLIDSRRRLAKDPTMMLGESGFYGQAEIQKAPSTRCGTGRSRCEAETVLLVFLDAHFAPIFPVSSLADGANYIQPGFSP